ncbi:MAG: 2-keto-3-deoxygluconate permease [Defluviitaleaceae bacterium]|nr:2-keto-3-deoxygluconate permease [Defluviitaleaceae bacterium]
MQLGKVPVWDTINKIPGGIMLVPLFLGVLFNTFAPAALDIGAFTTALFRNGAMPLIAVLLFCSGAQINIRSAGMSVYKGGVLTASKVIIGTGAGVLFATVFGSGTALLGITPLALISALGNNNGGLYTALAAKYGDKSDVGGIAVLSSTDGPFFEMMLMGAVGVAAIPGMVLFATILPILIGMLLGNLDDKVRDFLRPGMTIAIFFFAFPLGAGLSLNTLLVAGPPGVLLALLALSTGLISYGIYKLVVPKNSRRTCAPGAAVGTTAGNAIATPAAIAAVDPYWLPFAELATAQVATSILVTALLCPFLVDFLYKWEEKRGLINYDVPPAAAIGS